MAKPPKNDFPMMSSDEGIVMFYPHVPKTRKLCVRHARQPLDRSGPKVEQFETAFRVKLALPGACVAVGSGTDALHLSYLLAGIKAGDEVLAPVFTCTATNIPLLYIGADIRFVDADPNTLNISIADLKSKISDRTRAIVCVHYGGLPCDMEAIGALASQYGIPVIEDAAQALGASYAGAPIGAIPILQYSASRRSSI